MIKLVQKGGNSPKIFYLEEDGRRIAFIKKEDYKSEIYDCMRAIYYVKIYNENEKQKVKEYVHRNITDRFYWL